MSSGSPTALGGASSAPLRVESISKTYPGNSAATLDNISFALAPGERLSLLGPSGSGKSTLLHIMAGFVKPDVGRVHVGEKDFTNVAAHRRGIGVVFQNLALFPHLSVSQNVAFGLRMRGVDRQSQKTRTERILKLVNLEAFAQRKPSQISGGQKQRVAFARAVVTEPPVLLLDEPFGALDTRLREDIRGEFILLQERLGIATILVTHDQEEALSFGHRVAVLNAGKICQIASPEAIYETPSDAFVATFVGKGSLLPAIWGGRVDGKMEVRLGNHVLRCAETSLRGQCSNAPGSPVQFFVRPDWLSLVGGSETASSAAIVGSGRIERRRFAGDHFEYDVALDSGEALMVSVSPFDRNFEVGDAVGVELRAGRVPCVFPKGSA